MTSTLLVTMPWAGVDVALAQLGLLKAIARRAGHRADDLYANLALLEWLDIDLYTRIAQGDVPVVTGEWLFAPHLLDAEALSVDPKSPIRPPILTSWPGGDGFRRTFAKS